MTSTTNGGVSEYQGLWTPQPGWLDTASYGLPPAPAWEALRAALADWCTGRVSWREWDEATGRGRNAYARLLGVDAADVAVGAQVSQLLAPVAAAVPDGGTVLVPEQDFSSLIYPFAAHADRGVTVRGAPLAKLADHIDADVDTVAFSLVQSATGEIADYRRIVAAARAVNAWVVVDATQACGWLPLAEGQFAASAADAVVAGAYKWLMSPRGTGLGFFSPALRERMRPLAASWYSAADIHESYYGLPMRLAADARAFDISPAWHPWVGTAPALELVEQIGVERIRDHNVALANRFLTGLGRPPSDSAIVTVDVPGAEEKLAAAGIRAAVRAGRVRASFHVYTTVDDVDAALEALA